MIKEHMTLGTDAHRSSVFMPGPHYIVSSIPLPSVAESPLIGQEEITDNRFLLEDLMEEMTQHTDRLLETSNIYQLYLDARECCQQAYGKNIQKFKKAKSGEVYTRTRDENGAWTPWIPISFELERMCQWLETDQLPNNIRHLLLELYLLTDDLGEYVRKLSQSRWEKLQMWSAQRV